MSETRSFEGWAVVELMGHVRIAGHVRPEEHYGKAMLRVDVPGEDGAATTQLYSPDALYCITPTTEEIARTIAKRSQRMPIYPFELRQLPAPTESNSLDVSDDDHWGEEGD
jgi:hypothetical protein